MSAAQPTAAREPAAVHVGVLSILAEAGLYIALERGYFAEEGLTPDFTTFDTGAKAIPALATGQVDASGGAFSPGFVNATQRGVGVKMVGSLSSYEEGSNAGFIMVRREVADQRRDPRLGGPARPHDRRAARPAHGAATSWWRAPWGRVG